MLSGSYSSIFIFIMERGIFFLPILNRSFSGVAAGQNVEHQRHLHFPEIAPASKFIVKKTYIIFPKDFCLQKRAAILILRQYFYEIE